MSEPHREIPADPHPELPVDPDPDALRARPLHLRPAAIGLVALGGTVGTASREALSLAIPDAGALPLAILLINLSGAFALGMLLEALVRRGPDRGPRRTLRLLLGTGFLGGFTTYSALATDSARLLGSGQALAGVGYALGTLVVGGVATWLGILVASARRRTGSRG